MQVDAGKSGQNERFLLRDLLRAERSPTLRSRRELEPASGT
jgi:hypothetical protein